MVPDLKKLMIWSMRIKYVLETKNSIDERQRHTVRELWQQRKRAEEADTLTSRNLSEKR